MALRELKKELNQMDKTEIIKLILEMYKKIPNANGYFGVMVPPVSVKQCHFERSFNNTKNVSS